MKKELYFEEMEEATELGAFAEFCEAAAPWVGIGLGAAVGIVAFT